jgi:hypothetical protein
MNETRLAGASDVLKALCGSIVSIRVSPADSVARYQ